LGFALELYRAKCLFFVGWVEVRNPTLQFGLNPTYQKPDFPLLTQAYFIDADEGMHMTIRQCRFSRQAFRKARHMFKTVFGCQHEAKKYIV